MRYQLEVRVRILMTELGVDEKGLAAELGINLAHVRQIRDGSWVTITGDELQKLAFLLGTLASLRSIWLRTLSATACALKAPIW